MIEWPLVSVAVNGIELLALIWLLIHLRHSAGPYQAALIEQQRREVDTIHNHLRAIERDVMEDRRRGMLSADEIQKELRLINARLDEWRCPLADPACPLHQKT